MYIELDVIIPYVFADICFYNDEIENLLILKKDAAFKCQDQEAFRLFLLSY